MWQPFKNLRTNQILWGVHTIAGDKVSAIKLNNVPDMFVTDRLQDVMVPDTIYTFNSLTKDRDNLVVTIKEKFIS